MPIGRASLGAGLFCYPQPGTGKTLQFGDVTRLRYVEKAGASEFKHFGDQIGKTSLLFNAMRPRSPDAKHFGEPYMHADLADLNRDGLTDVVFAPRQWGFSTKFFLCLNTGKRDAGGMPIWEAAGTVAHPKRYWGPVRAVDLDQDGAIDLVAGGMYDTDQASEGYGTVYYYRNTNPKGWPLQLADPVPLDAGRRACFYDVDGDERLDSVCLIHDPHSTRKVDWIVAWRKNLGGGPPRFANAKALAGIGVSRCVLIAAVPQGPRRGLLVAHGHYRKVSLFEQQETTDGQPQFVRHRALSTSAVITVGDQAWPYFCDWDGDGDRDLLCGNGHGWPWIVVNEGTSQRPRYAEPPADHSRWQSDSDFNERRVRHARIYSQYGLPLSSLCRLGWRRPAGFDAAQHHQPDLLVQEYRDSFEAEVRSAPTIARRWLPRSARGPCEDRSGPDDQTRRDT